MRVVHIISGLRPSDGGPTSALIGLAIAQKAIGMDISVVWTARAGDPLVSQNELEAAGIPVVRVEPCWTSYRFSIRTSKLLHATLQHADMVHLHGIFEHVHLAAARRCLQLKIPYIVRPCGLLDQWSLRQKRVKKRIYLWCFAHTVIAGAEALHLASDFERKSLGISINQKQIIIVPNGVSISDEAIDVPTKNEREFYGEHDPYAVFVGRIHPKKGISFIIEAFQRFQNLHTPVVIIGDGEAGYVQALKLKISELGLKNLIKFIGAKHGIERDRLVYGAEYLCLPSMNENFANVVIESLALGTPVIISDQVGLAPFVDRNHLGAICQADAQSLAKAMSEFRCNESREEFRKRSRQLVREEFSWTTIAEQWRKHYQILMQKDSAR